VRHDLPAECTCELDYRALIETISFLEGEQVCISIEGLSSSRIADGRSPRIGVVGQLRMIDYSWADGFAVADSGRVLLYEPDFVSAFLRTFDGNDFFRVEICFGDMAFVLGDESSALDEFAK
jgi:hypothetical protein